MVAVGGDIAGVVAEDGVVREEVGQGPRICNVVDRDDLEVATAMGGTVNVAPDAAKPIDANLYRHEASPRSLSGLRDFPHVNLLDHFDSTGPPVAAADSRPRTC